MNWEIGQIEQGQSPQSGVIDKEIIDHASVWLLEEARLNDNAKVYFGVGGAYFFVFPRNLGANPYAHSKRSAVGLTDAHGEFTFFRRDEESHGLRLKAGIFPFKYNPDAKNLGEYLFRTFTYPTVITTGGLEFVNSAATQLSGFDFDTRLGGFSNDLLLTLQTDRPPVLSLSLTDIASYSFGGLFTVGAGFMFDSFYHPDKEGLQPKGLDNGYFTLSNGREVAQTRYKYESESGLLDPATVTITDTNYYTFTGQKAMFQASMDFGKLLPSGMLSEQDLRLYFEAVLMGLKDYPTYYEKMGDRIAYMAGLNLPTFRLLDIFSVEVEYCANPFENTTIGPIGNKSITPFISAGGWGSYQKESQDDIKWTLYARRSLYQGLSIHAQVAKDHIRMFDVFSTPDVTEFLPNKNDWYWVFKLSYAI